MGPLGGKLAILAHLYIQPCLTLGIVQGMVDQEYHGQHLMAIRFKHVATWRLIVWGIWWNTFECLHMIMIRKIETKI